MEMNGNDSDADPTTSSPIQQQTYMFTEETPPDEHKPLSGTLTRLHDDSKSFFKLRMWEGFSLDQLIALTNGEELELEEIYGILSSLRLFFHLSFIHPILSDVRFTYHRL